MMLAMDQRHARRVHVAVACGASIALLLCLLLGWHAPRQVLLSYLVAGMFCLSLSLGSMALLMVGPLISAMTGPSWRPLVRSHSQALSRAGRPKVPKNPLSSSTPESGNSAARVPTGTPGILETAPVTRCTVSYSTSAGRRRARACE